MLTLGLSESVTGRFPEGMDAVDQEELPVSSLLQEMPNTTRKEDP